MAARILLSGIVIILLPLLKSLGETYEVSDGLYSFTAGLHTSVFIISGSGCIIIDPMNTEHKKQMLQEIKNITIEPIKYVYYSYNRWDHTAGRQVFKDVGAKIVAHSEAYEWIKANLGNDVVFPDQIWPA